MKNGFCAILVGWCWLVLFLKMLKLINNINISCRKLKKLRIYANLNGCHWLVLFLITCRFIRYLNISHRKSYNISFLHYQKIGAGQCYFSKFSNSSNIQIFCLEFIKNWILCYFSWLVLVSAISQNSQIHQIFIDFAQNVSTIGNYAILIGQCWLLILLKILKFIKYSYILLRMHQ